ncbi:hypothetical protein HPB49_001501 [Dermacentor silvarum]|uniref:Uncharacterized protein n=1 Tax=Dermacentor silvarum TaxID=543639 RepID=A0ACB8CCR5_DERSI|nr:hypothetical protein HPB49_001501 [Dermacentor silvarum]
MADPPAAPPERDSRPQDVSSVQLRLPLFWTQNLQVWFHQIEAQICLYCITSETTRYYDVASVLPPDVASELSDVLSTPKGTTPYQHLKTKNSPIRFIRRPPHPSPLSHRQETRRFCALRLTLTRDPFALSRSSRSFTHT